MAKIFILALFSVQVMFSGLYSDTKEAEVTKRLQAFAQAFNQGNADQLSTFWTQDAEVVRPDQGEVFNGKDEIVKVLQKRVQELKERRLKFSFRQDKINFPAEDQAVILGVVEVRDDKDQLLLRDARRVELVRQSGQWLIDSVNDIEVAPAPPVYNRLKEIEWLIGKWKDSDEDVTVVFNNRWDKYKNFIISRFTMTVFSLEEMEGIQIIGWDPIKKKIQSWLFDSDGGYGSGEWTKNGSSWEVALNYTLSDGKKGSGTNIYTKVDDTHYRFASKNRQLDGAAVEDIEPVTVVKEE
jgi:ketosteroid isomerase-like protein